MELYRVVPGELHPFYTLDFLPLYRKHVVH
jgi:hypothetical protein